MIKHDTCLKWECRFSCSVQTPIWPFYTGCSEHTIFISKSNIKFFSNIRKFFCFAIGNRPQGQPHRIFLCAGFTMSCGGTSSYVIFVYNNCQNSQSKFAHFLRYVGIFAELVVHFAAAAFPRLSLRFFFCFLCCLHFFCLHKNTGNQKYVHLSFEKLPPLSA